MWKNEKSERDKSWNSRRIKQWNKKVKVTDVIVVGYFNKDLHSKNIEEFMVEMGSYDAFKEIHDVEEKYKDGTFGYVSNCIGVELVSEIML